MAASIACCGSVTILQAFALFVAVLRAPVPLFDDRFFEVLFFLLVVVPPPGRVIVTKFSPTELIV
jgi:hypothetical protein